MDFQSVAHFWLPTQHFCPSIFFNVAPFFNPNLGIEASVMSGPHWPRIAPVWSMIAMRPSATVPARCFFICYLFAGWDLFQVTSPIFAPTLAAKAPVFASPSALKTEPCLLKFHPALLKGLV